MVGDVGYHTSRKRITNLRRKLHEANGYKGFHDAPLPPVFMNFSKQRFEDRKSQGIAKEDEANSLIGRATQMVAAGLITKRDDRILSNICSLIVELWYHGRNVFESKIIELSNPDRLDEEDRYDWSALGLESETHEDSILGLTKKLAAMRYLNREDEAVIEDYCFEIATRWAKFEDESVPKYEPSAEPTNEAGFNYKTGGKEKAPAYSKPCLIPQEPFSSQLDELDTLFDSRSKLAQIHILAAEDEPESIYYLDPEMAKEIDIHTNMPSPQIRRDEPEERKRSKHMLSEVEWEILNSAFDRQGDPNPFNTESDIDSDSDTASYYESSEDDSSGLPGIHIVDTVHNLSSLAKTSPVVLSPLTSSTNSSSGSESQMSSACSTCEFAFPRFSPVSPGFRSSTALPTFSATRKTMQERLQSQLFKLASSHRVEPSHAFVAGNGVECRMVNDVGEAFEWAIVL